MGTKNYAQVSGADIAQRDALVSAIKAKFERTGDYTELLLTILFTDKDGIVHRLVHDMGRGVQNW